MRESLDTCLQKNGGDAYVELRGEDLRVRTIVLQGDTQVRESKREGVGIRVIDRKEVFLPSSLDELEKKVGKAISLAQEGDERIEMEEISIVKARVGRLLTFPPLEESLKVLTDFYWELRECQDGSVYLHYSEVEGEKYVKTSEGLDIEKDIAFWKVGVQISGVKKRVNVSKELNSQVEKMDLSGVKERLLKGYHAQMEGSNPKTGTFPCVLGPIVAGCVVHEAIGHNCEADFADQGLYWMKGQKIAPEFVTIIDDGRYPGGAGTEKYDDEGVLTSTVEIMRNGVLKSFLTDRIWAKKMGLPLTGSARGASFQVNPLIRMRNTILEEGNALLNELMEDIKFGYFCEYPQYSRVENFQFRVGLQECYEINHGEIGNPVVPHYIGGDTFSFMENIKDIGSDSDCANFDCEKGQKILVSQISPSILMNKGGIYIY